MLAAQGAVPPDLLGAEGPVRGGADQERAPRQVPVPSGLLLLRGQLLGGVLAQRLQHAEAHVRRAVVLAREHRLLQQPVDEVEHVRLVDAVAGAHHLGGLQGEPAGEDRQPGPEQPLVGRAQVAARLQRGAQRALPRRSVPCTLGEQPLPVARPIAQPIAQPVEDALGRQHEDPGRRQLDGERNPLERLAELRDRGGVVLGEPERRQRGGRPGGEERLRLVGRQRPDRQHDLTGHAELPRGRDQHPQPGRRGEQHRHQLRRRVEHRRAAVEHQQTGSVGDRGGDISGPRGAVRQPDPERAGHRVPQEVGIDQVGEVDRPRLLPACPLVVGRRGTGQGRLADPGRPGERDQPRRTQCPPQVGELLAPPEQGLTRTRRDHGQPRMWGRLLRRVPHGRQSSSSRRASPCRSRTTAAASRRGARRTTGPGDPTT